MSSKTRKAFLDDAYLTACEGKVVAINERGGIILDCTNFYATSGGQPGDSGKGFNLGLYITRNFTRLQNGELTVASKEGKGTTITLSFPLAPEAKPREPKAAGTAGRRNGKSKRRG